MAVETALGPNLQGTNPGPNWSGFTTNWADFVRNVNGFPPAGLFGGGTVSIPEAIRGAINIPASSSPNNHGAGVAGYAMSASTTKGAVGVFGLAEANANGVSTWGANFAAANCATPWANCISANSGFNNWTGYGIEVDVGVQPMTGGAAPSHFLRGVYVVNAGNVNATGYAFDADNPVNTSTMSAAFHTSDGFSNTFGYIGTTASGNNTGSQNVVFRSRDSGGTLRTSSIFADPNGNFIFVAGPGALMVLEDGAGNSALSLQPNGSTPLININYALNMGASAAGDHSASSNRPPASATCA